MFTGIIRATSRIISLAATPAGALLTIEKPQEWQVKLGESLAVNGICSTVKEIGQSKIVFEYMPETIARTTVSDWQKGELVNLEQSLKLSDRLDGHFVQGHVDCPGEITEIRPEGNSLVLTIAPSDQAQMRLIAEKGSVAVDGISLTVTAVTRKDFRVKIIPYTQMNTSLGQKKCGQRVNLEFDLVAKYLERLMQKEA